MGGAKRNYRSHRAGAEIETHNYVCCHSNIGSSFPPVWKGTEFKQWLRTYSTDGLELLEPFQMQC